MCLQCTGWVFGGYFIHFLAMYLQCTCWVHRPLPPSAIGSLMYAAIGTRPDITFTVTVLSQYLQNPGRPHWEQAKRAIRYLKGTRDWKLKFGPTGGVEGFTDANWGNDADDRHSICGYVFMLNGGAISWSSKKQSIVALSCHVFCGRCESLSTFRSFRNSPGRFPKISGLRKS